MSEKDKYHTILLIGRIFKKMIQINLSAKQKQIHRLTDELITVMGGRIRGGID